MIFISLIKLRKKTTKELAAANDKSFSALQKQGVKVLGWYYTLGRYDTYSLLRGQTKERSN